MSRRPLEAIAEWRERDRAAFERMHQTMQAADVAASEVVVSVDSPDGGVTIEVGGDSRLRKITIDPDAYDTYDADQLADIVLVGLRAARRQVKQQQLVTFQEQFVDRRDAL